MEARQLSSKHKARPVSTFLLGWDIPTDGRPNTEEPRQDSEITMGFTRLYSGIKTRQTPKRKHLQNLHVPLKHPELSFCNIRVTTGPESLSCACQRPQYLPAFRRIEESHSCNRSAFLLMEVSRKFKFRVGR